MLFNSFGFLLFFPCVFLLYYALPFRFRKFLLLASSWYFYMCWKPEFIVLILFSTAVDYFCGLGIGRWRQRRGIFLAISLVMNLGLLFFFKYFNFFGQTLTALCRAVSIPWSVPVLDIILPVGISFYTFQTLSYTIDVYRGKLAPERDFVTFALFVSYFPQLVAGPIERAENLLPQLKEEHPFSYDNAVSGLKLMAWGFFKKCVAAAYLAMWVDPVYGNVTAYSGGALVVATCAFALQIYCDFGGYSDIARGCARMMGVELMVNFRSPYFFSHSIGEYWKRNHISLSEWFHQYVYIPLGGNRKGRLKKYCFLTVTFFLSGLWHGAAWTFVTWGLLQAVYLIGEDLARRTRPDTGNALKPGHFRHVLSILRTFALSCFSLIFFRAGSMGDALYVVRHLLDGLANPLAYGKAAYWAVSPGTVSLAATALSVALLFVYDLADEHGGAIAAVSRRPLVVRWCVYVGFLLMLVMLIPRETPAPFIYFQF